jgi:hypothetical protein
VREIDALGQLLETGIGVVGGNTLHLGSDADIPAGDAPVLSILETGGPITPTHNAGVIGHPSFQIMARGSRYPDVATLLDLAFEELGGKGTGLGLSNITVGDWFFLWIRPTSKPFSLPKDANSRVRLAFNVETCCRKAA